MDVVKAVLSLTGTVVIAGWVAYSVSAPRNVENMLNEPMASLDGGTIADEMREAQSKAKQAQCAEYKDAAQRAWDRSLEKGTSDRDAAQIDRLDRQVERFCN
jgi:hypothetical protein